MSQITIRDLNFCEEELLELSKVTAGSLSVSSASDTDVDSSVGVKVNVDINHGSVYRQASFRTSRGYGIATAGAVSFNGYTSASASAHSRTY